MTIIEPDDLPELLLPGKTLAGLDLGKKTLGLALSDRSLCFAHPFPVLRRTTFTRDIKTLFDLFQKENVVAAVIGLPLNMNGTEGPSAQRIRSFVRNTLAFADFPFLLRDERLSTIAARRVLLEADLSRKKQAQKIDSVAAAFILQGVLDEIRFRLADKLYR